MIITSIIFINIISLTLLILKQIGSILNSGIKLFQSRLIEIFIENLGLTKCILLRRRLIKSIICLKAWMSELISICLNEGIIVILKCWKGIGLTSPYIIRWLYVWIDWTIPFERRVYLLIRHKTIIWKKWVCRIINLKELILRVICEEIFVISRLIEVGSCAGSLERKALFADQIIKINMFSIARKRIGIILRKTINNTFWRSLNLDIILCILYWKRRFIHVLILFR